MVLLFYFSLMCVKKYKTMDTPKTIKDDVKYVLCIGSAHDKGGPTDINIAQKSHLSNFSDLKLWFIFVYEHSNLTRTDRYSVIVRYCKHVNNKGFVYITDFTTFLPNVSTILQSSSRMPACMIVKM